METIEVPYCSHIFRLSFNKFETSEESGAVCLVASRRQVLLEGHVARVE
jgi:hypothetical protein